MREESELIRAGSAPAVAVFFTLVLNPASCLLQFYLFYYSKAAFQFVGILIKLLVKKVARFSYKILPWSDQFLILVQIIS